VPTLPFADAISLHSVMAHIFFAPQPYLCCSPHRIIRIRMTPLLRCSAGKRDGVRYKWHEDKNDTPAQTRLSGSKRHGLLQAGRLTSYHYLFQSCSLAKICESTQRKSLKPKELGLTRSHKATEFPGHSCLAILCVSVPLCESIRLRPKAALGPRCPSWWMVLEKSLVAAARAFGLRCWA
jgi:hypothetical protein